ncbi:hypothetical protein EXIGLDRAFT_205171 [Exidia glandulosa HHB12029]|uniref:Uncharacterized protein n=1 Tax=Exidia glandulosa HHB12029 TaxID=1314781 RepID=A0A165MUF6_EXIGL|nr:hypothetical protein EXIGLDRAFT_205171 [Exidia glandulosa HHB12029]
MAQWAHVFCPIHSESLPCSLVLALVLTFIGSSGSALPSPHRLIILSAYSSVRVASGNSADCVAIHDSITPRLRDLNGYAYLRRRTLYMLEERGARRPETVVRQPGRHVLVARAEHDLAIILATGTRIKLQHAGVGVLLPLILFLALPLPYVSTFDSCSFQRDFVPASRAPNRHLRRSFTRRVSTQSFV